MKTLKQDKAREIIDDFARDIEKRKRSGPKPAKDVIDFRTDRRDGRERDIWYVPVELLRYRKDNGRISSDVLHYEKAHGSLCETSEDAQRQIEKFLREKDAAKTEELKASIEHDGQREPTIITCDGFLINGNRRKMVLEELRAKHPNDERFKFMRVIILPGKDSKDEGGPPTLREIEEIENRYQLQSEAKAEYSNFDRALSMRRKIQMGMSLEQQLKDDPIYAGLDDKKFKQAVKKHEEDYLKPLECIDRYLEQLGREGLYSTVAMGIGDPEGRWQAFLDYYNSVYSKLCDDGKRIQLGISEDQVGEVEAAAFRIIRARDLPDQPKVHKIMRDLPKSLKNPDARTEILKLAELSMDLPKSRKGDHDGAEQSEREIDKRWSAAYAKGITDRIKRAAKYCDYQSEKETPLELLESALARLNDDRMNPRSLNVKDIAKARQLISKIQYRTNFLKRQLYLHGYTLESSKSVTRDTDDDSHTTQR